jgi:transcription-repair coupling factor (superfamily II helicase)
MSSSPPRSSTAQLVAAALAGPVHVHGLPPAASAYVATELIQQPEMDSVVLVCGDDGSAEQLRRDLEFFLGDPVTPGAPARGAAGILTIPARDGSPYAELSTDRGALARHMAALFRLAAGGPLAATAVVVSASALLRRIIPPAELLARSAVITSGGAQDRDTLVQLLERAGFTRVSLVADPGTYAVRGGVVDVFAPLHSQPARLEFFGDTVESIRTFDPESQRTLRQLDELRIHPVREAIATSGADPRQRILAAADAAAHPSSATRRLLEAIATGEEFIGLSTLVPAFHAGMAPLWQLLPAGRRSCWLLLDPDRIAQVTRDEFADAEARYQACLDEHKIAFAPHEHYVHPDELATALAAVPHRIEVRGVELYRPEHQPGHPGVSLHTSADSADRSAGGPGPVPARVASHRDTSGSEPPRDGANPGPERAGAALPGALPGPAPRRLYLAVDDQRPLRDALTRARRQHADELVQPLLAALARYRDEGWRVAIACDSASRSERLAALLGASGVTTTTAPRGLESLRRLPPGGPPALVRGLLSAGFGLPEQRLALIGEDEIFGPRRHGASQQQAAARRAHKALLGASSDFSTLAAGDHLVHQVHGVGRYEGLKKLPVGGTLIDFLQLTYDGGNLYLPVYRLSELTRYVGAEGHKPRLDKLGGVTWERARRKVASEVRALAEGLLQLYAQRAALPGHAFPPGDAMFAEFEATFEFDETPDQARAIGDVLADMEQPRPMDRLVCGDVGYGKTEVALRAVLKCVLDGKQAAMLAPTTVLVEQHYQTMVKRFEGWPVRVARLSRFQPRADQLATVKGLATGSIDVVVGTHRLLSADVRFRDLGLLVVDEEQRFGVTHKERLKKMRTQIDVLTLTATPIPRTLHLAMSGLRDLSIIATPPADRRSIRTFVSLVDDGVIREAIARELDRGGQIFFVAPRIGDAGPGAARRDVPRAGGDTSLDGWAAYLRRLSPRARVVVAHGQMAPAALEKIMVDFVAGAHDILVSTTIIETGLDIPRANTMFVARADSFGLSQLYQLRGRIGRSKERAYCYLLVPPLDQLTEEARRRLEVLQRFSDLGAGFQIASHDLEIRGGGELLGARQSGAIAAVGFEQYTAMLHEAVAELRGEEIHPARDPELNVETPGYIPDELVPDTGQRLDLYKRLSCAEDRDEIDAILSEMSDRYGTLPDEVGLLGDLMAVKAHARRLRALSVELTAERLSLTLGEDTPLRPEQIARLVAQADNRLRLTPDSRLQRLFSSDEAQRPTEAAERCLLQLLACAT